MKPTFKDVAALISYAPDSGILTWKVNRRGKAKAGTEAGSIETIRKSKHTQYRRVTLFNVKYFAHHIAVLLMTGEWPEMVDHDDRNGLNNAWHNLTITDPVTNNRNRGFSGNAVGHTGVYKNPKSKGYYVNIGGKYRGSREELSDAIALRDSIYLSEGYHPKHGDKV